MCAFACVCAWVCVCRCVGIELLFQPTSHSSQIVSQITLAAVADSLPNRIVLHGVEFSREDGDHSEMFHFTNRTVILLLQRLVLIVSICKCIFVHKWHFVPLSMQSTSAAQQCNSISHLMSVSERKLHDLWVLFLCTGIRQSITIPYSNTTMQHYEPTNPRK